MNGDRTLRQRLFMPRDLNELAPVPKVVTYALLLLWTLVVVFPLYWVLITSFKLPVDVNDGPDYLPFIDFTPSGHAWRYIFVDLGRDTLRPYLNSVIVALSSTFLAVLIGTAAAYSLVRITMRVKLAAILAFLLLLAAVVVAVWRFGAPWSIAAVLALALFVLFLTTLGRRFRRAVGNEDIQFWIISNRILPPVVVVLPIYVMFQQLHLLDTRFALIATYTAVNLPIVVWLMRDFIRRCPLRA